MFKKVKIWIPLVLILTAVCALIYATGQQLYRQNANDPQIQLSEDIASSLSKGDKPESFISNAFKIDISKSLAVFAIIYDNNLNEVISNASLDGKTPVLPKGVLSFAKEHRQNRITWQPKEGVRIAAIVTRFDGNTNKGYVLVGRSLREIEKRENQLLLRIGLTWIIIVSAALFTSTVYKKHKE